MSRADNLHELPEGLPVPTDDGACDHLPGMWLPPVALPSAAGERVNLSKLSGRTVVYCYPRTGRPGEDPPQGRDGHQAPVDARHSRAPSGTIMPDFRLWEHACSV